MTFLPTFLLIRTIHVTPLRKHKVRKLLECNFLFDYLMLCQVKQSHGFFLHGLTAGVLETYVVLEVDLPVGMVCASV